MSRPLLLVAVLLVSAGCGASSRSVERGTTVTADGENRPVETELRRFPGVDVRETPDGVEVRVRGTSSFMGDGPPLFVVDGTQRATGPGGALVGIRRAEIVDIRVLKSVADVAEYGSRGANGVVLIRTRSASR